MSRRPTPVERWAIAAALPSRTLEERRHRRDELARALVDVVNAEGSQLAAGRVLGLTIAQVHRSMRHARALGLELEPVRIEPGGWRW